MLVNIVYFPPIKAGKDEEFRKWFVWSNEEFAKFKGFGGRKLLLPRDGGNYVAIVEHESDETFIAMHSSPVHAQAQQKVLPMFEGSPKPQFYKVVEL